MAWDETWRSHSWSGGINYTGSITRLMHDIISRVPTLGFIDLDRVLVFARPGRSSADGAYASCHCLGLPQSDPGYFFWRDRQTGAVTRRSEWFVTKSPQVLVDGMAMNYLVSFALPRFTDQTLARSRKQDLYPAGTPDWVAKLDTVVHELYHIDPAQNCLRRFPRADGEPSDALHHATYFQEVAALVQEYLATRPDPAILGFLRENFDEVRARHAGVAALTFRSFPSYPRRYREAIDGPPVPADLQQLPVEPVVDTSEHVFSERDLQLRHFTGAGARVVEHFLPGMAA